MADETKRKTSPGEFVRQVRSETSKVVWPTRDETIRTAIFVFIMMVILSLFFVADVRISLCNHSENGDCCKKEPATT